MVVMGLQIDIMLGISELRGSGCIANPISSAVPSLMLISAAGQVCCANAELPGRLWPFQGFASAFIDVASDVLNILCANDMLNMWLC